MRSFRKLAEELEDVIFALAGDKMQSYSLNNVTYTKQNLSELTEIYMTFRDLAFRETNGNVARARVR